MTTSRRADSGVSGLAVIDKPGGLTSHQVVSRVRRLAGTRRVGHAGTLDPMATGVLVLGINRATRLLGQLSATVKRYSATIRLGSSTITDDAEGEITASPGAVGVPAVAIEQAMAALTGELQQVPSSVSAIKVGGVRSYARVRGGEDVTLAARPVTVSEFALLARRDDVPARTIELDVTVECTAGTYVRALARDLGAALGTGGHLTALRRTTVGAFGLDRAQTLEAAASDGLMIIGIDQAANDHFARVDLDPDQAEAVRHGRRLLGQAMPADPTAVYDPDGRFLALYRNDGTDAAAVSVFVD